MTVDLIRAVAARRRRPCSGAECVRWLRWITRDEYFDYAENRIPLRALGRLCGISDDSLHMVQRDGVITARSIERLAPVIDAIDKRRIVFCHGNPYALPAGAVPELPITPLALASLYTLGARCRVCRSWKFVPVGCGQNSCVVCYDCYPPALWPAAGLAYRKVELVAPRLRIVYGDAALALPAWRRLSNRE